MIDLHCHLLPGVDDGPETLEESLAMAQAAYEDGIRTVVVTPHAYSSYWRDSRLGKSPAEELEEKTLWLEGVLAQAGFALRLYPGMEVDLDLNLVSRLGDGRVRPLHRGPYFLLELPFFQYPLYAPQVIFQTQLHGWKPILTHPERYAYVQENPGMITTLVQRGILVQVMSGSLTGDAGPNSQRTAEWLLRHNLAHVLASDGHRATGPRAPLLSRAVEIAAGIIGEERAHSMVTEVPQRILAGESLEMPRADTRTHGQTDR
jgi:protein-tyrosine phosphatase